MSRLLLRRKSSIKANLKPLSIEKISSTGTGTEFRWSLFAPQFALTKENSSSNFHLIDLDKSRQKPFFSSPFSITRPPMANRTRFSTKKRSPRLPYINNNNKKQKTNLSILTNSSNNEEIKQPLLLTYAQIYQVQHDPLQTKKISRTRFPIQPLVNNKRSSNAVLNTHVSFSSDSTSTPPSPLPLITDKQIRLHTPQLRRLHVSEKYMEEAKTLYFNATSRAFVPRLSIEQIF